MSSFSTIFLNLHLVSFLQLEEGLIKATPLQEATDVSDCSGCKVVINALDKRMQTMSRDELLNNMLQVINLMFYW
jgi:hypothetical protein